MARTFPITRKNSTYFCLDTFWCGVQNSWVHISLKGNFATNTMTSRGYICCPIQTQRCSSCSCHRLKPLTSTLGEKNYGHLPSFMFADQTIYNFLHVCQRKLLIC